MPSFIRCLMLAVVAVVLSAGSASAQKKDSPKDKEPAKAGAAVKKDALGTIEIYKAKDGYRFRIKDADGKVLAMPTKGVEDKETVEKLLAIVRETLIQVKPTEVKGDK